jgi:hypothetical protein
VVYPVEWILVTLNIYRRVFRRAGALAIKNWAVMGTVFVYSAIMSAAGLLSMMLGIIGGFLLSLVWAACVGSFLYLVEMMVRTSRVNLDDFRNSFGRYLWDVVGVAFLSWVFFTLATPAILQMPQGHLILLCVELALLVFFNAVPELIYLGHYSSVQLLSESYAFVAANWLEWFPANLAAAVILYAAAAVPPYGVAMLGRYPVMGLRYAVLGLVIYFFMVMRGLLFIELHGSTHRGRAFKYRSGA